MDTDARVSFLMDLIQCNYRFLLWKYDFNGILLSEHRGYEHLFNALFVESNCIQDIIRHVQSHKEKCSTEPCPPVIISNMLDLMWFAVFDLYQETIYVVGPAFTSEYSKQLLYPLVKNKPELITQYHNILKLLQSITIISTQNFMHYTISFHYCVTGQHIHSGNIVPLSCSKQNTETLITGKDQRKDASYLGIWQSEQQLLKCVEDGNIRYLEPFGNSRRISYGIKLARSTSLRQEKDSYIIFLALCVNSAIKGGLSPTVAYSLQNAYVQKIEACSSQTALIGLGNCFFVDITEKVHEAKSHSSLSQPIKSTCEYIGIHLFDELSIDDIASRVGYSNYYLTRKFKQETGITLTDYIRQKRIDQAKLLLATTDLSVQSISESLYFCSRSYFSEIFQRIVGMSPNEYRKQNIRT